MVLDVDRADCAQCGTDLTASGPCPTCGSGDRHIFVTDQALGFDGFGLQARHGQPGEVRPFKVVKDEVKWNHDRQRKERCRELYDRENKHYVQEWSDLDSGAITFRKEGRLDDSDIHGESARRPRE
jgi:hypothetical protein